MMKGKGRLKILAWGLLGLCTVLALGGAAVPKAFHPDGDEDEGMDFLKRREEWFARPRQQGIPKGKTAAELLMEARKKALAMPVARFQSKSSKPLSQKKASNVAGLSQAFSTWSPIGPQPIVDNNGTSHSGRGTAIAVDLTHDPTGNTVYYGAANGGVWKSTNAAGPSPVFTPISDQNQDLAVGAIALDTSVNPPVIYVGTGEANLSESFYGIGIMKSVDGGNTWTLASTANSGAISFLGMGFFKIAVDPTNPQIILASTDISGGIDNPLSGLTTSAQGLFRSADGGATWTQISSLAGQRVTDIVFDPTRNVFFAAVWNQGFFQSADHGQTWTVLPSPFAGGAAVNSGNFNRSSLALRNGTIYGLIALNNLLSQPAAADTGIVQSTDGGNTWTPIADPVVSGVNPVSVLGTQLPYDQFIAAPPNSTSLVIGGQGDVFTTTAANGTSTTWTKADPPHSDHHAFAAIDAVHWFEANDGGLFFTSNSGQNWSSLNGTLQTLQFYSISPDSLNPGTVSGGSQDNGIEATTGAVTWNQVGGGDQPDSEPDLLNPGQFFGEIGGGSSGSVLHFSTAFNSQTTVVNLTEGFFGCPIRVIPQIPQTMMAAPNAVWMGPTNPSTPGAGWRIISPHFGANFLGLAPSNPNVVYAVAGNQVFRCVSALATTPSWVLLTPFTDGFSLGDIAVSPTDPNTVYLLKEGFIPDQKAYKSTDGGNTWTNISGNLPNAPMNWVTVDPLDPNDIYVASDVGVFVATDGGTVGEAWQNAGTGLPDAAAAQIRISPQGRNLVAGTHGRGAWILNIGDAPATASSCLSYSTLWGCGTSFAQADQPCPPSSANGQFNHPNGLAVDSARSAVYVAESVNNRIQKLDTNGNWLATISPTLPKQAFTHGLAVDGQGNLFAGDAGNNQIDVFDPNGNLLFEFDGSASGKAINLPSAIAVDSQDDVFVGDFNNFRMLQFKVNVAARSASFVTQWGSFGIGNNQFNFINAVAVDPSGNFVYVGDEDQHIQKFAVNPESFTTSWNLSRGLYQNVGFVTLRSLALSVGPDGNIYASFDGSGNDPNGNLVNADNIQVFDPNGNLLSQFASNGSGFGQALAGFFGMGFDGCGNFYATDLTDNRVEVFKPCVSTLCGPSPTPTPACNMVDNLEDGNLTNFLGGAWAGYGWGTGTSFTNPPVVDATTGANGTTHSIKETGTNLTSDGQTGFGLLTTLNISGTPVNLGSSFAGLSFFAKASQPATLRAEIVSSANPDSDYYGFTFTVGTGFQQVTVPVSALTQKGFGKPVPLSTVLATALRLQWQTDSSAYNNMTFWVDEICLLGANPPTPTATPTVSGCGTSSAGLQLEEFTTCQANQANQTFEVINTGTVPLNLNQVTLKFWVDDTNIANPAEPIAGAVFYGGGFGTTNTAVNGVALNAVNFSPACGPDSTHQANWEITVSDTDTRTLSAGATWSNLQTSIHVGTNFANFLPGTGVWYSPCGVGAGSTYTNDVHYAVYYQGRLVTASGGTAPSCRPLPTCTPGGMMAAPLSAAEQATPTPTPTISPTPNTARGLSVVAAPNVSTGGQPIQFRVNLDKPAQVKLALFTLTGEEIYTASVQGGAGENMLSWNLGNQTGSAVASGLYLYEVNINDGMSSILKTGKVAVLH